MPEITIKQIEEVIEKGFDRQALMIQRAFDDTARREDLDRLEKKVDIIQGKLDNVLYKEINQMESRITKIEKHLGFKTA